VTCTLSVDRSGTSGGTSIPTRRRLGIGDRFLHQEIAQSGGKLEPLGLGGFSIIVGSHRFISKADQRKDVACTVAFDDQYRSRVLPIACLFFLKPRRAFRPISGLARGNPMLHGARVAICSDGLGAPELPHRRCLDCTELRSRQ
jgi:hypothetical protein